MHCPWDCIDVVIGYERPSCVRLCCENASACDCSCIRGSKLLELFSRAADKMAAENSHSLTPCQPYWPDQKYTVTKEVLCVNKYRRLAGLTPCLSPCLFSDTLELRCLSFYCFCTSLTLLPAVHTYDQKLFAKLLLLHALVTIAWSLVVEMLLSLLIAWRGKRPLLGPARGFEPFHDAILVCISQHTLQDC